MGSSEDYARYGFWRWKVLPPKMQKLAEEIKLKAPQMRGDRMELRSTKGLSLCLTGGYSMEGVLSVPRKRDFERVVEALKAVGKVKSSPEYEIAFVKESARENEKKVTGFTPEAMQALQRFTWPGNVRELRWAIESAVVLCRSERIGLRDLPEEIRDTRVVPSGAEEAAASEKVPELSVKEAEKQLIIRALDECRGNRTEAAKKLGMSRRTLHRKLHTYNLEDH